MRMPVRSRHTTMSECNKTAGYGEAGLLKPTKTKSFARHGIILQHPHGHARRFRIKVDSVQDSGYV